MSLPDFFGIIEDIIFIYAKTRQKADTDRLGTGTELFFFAFLS
jgi:hypothetical protein